MVLSPRLANPLPGPSAPPLLFGIPSKSLQPPFRHPDILCCPPPKILEGSYFFGELVPCPPSPGAPGLQAPPSGPPRPDTHSDSRVGEKLSGRSREPSHRAVSLEQEQLRGHFPFGGLQATPAPAPTSSSRTRATPPIPPPPRGPSLLGPPHSSAQAGATTSPRPGDPPSRQLARSALASLSPLSPFQSVLPVSLWCPIFCLFLFCLCASLVFLTQ